MIRARTQAYGGGSYVGSYVSYVDNYVAPPPEDDNDWSPPYVAPAFSGSPAWVSYVDNYVEDNYMAEAYGDYSGETYVAGYVAPEEGSWDWMNDEAANAMYGGACSTCAEIGSIGSDGKVVTASELRTAFYNQENPYAPPDTDSPVEIITPGGCRSRSRMRRSSARRSLKAKAKACLQANVGTMWKAVKKVGYVGEPRRAGPPTSPRRERGGAGGEPDEPRRMQPNLRRAI